MFLLFQNCGSYGSPAEFSFPSIVDLLTVTLPFFNFFFIPYRKIISLVREQSEETTFFFILFGLEIARQFLFEL